MGNQTSRRHSLHIIHRFTDRKSSKRHLHHTASGLLEDDSPEVETLKLSFFVCRKIFSQLSLRDLNACMLVCKEWRSLIDTCAFWRVYTVLNYDSKPHEVNSASPLFQWKYLARACLRDVTGVMDEYRYQTYIFEPFPDIWRCGIVVPHSLVPPDGNLDVYHNFLRAVDAVQRLVYLVSVHGMEHQLHVCMFQWMRDRLPTCKEVLDIFNASEIIVHGAADSECSLSRGELKSSFRLFTARDKRHSRFEAQFFNDVVRWTGPATVVCDSSVQLADPAPCFLLTLLSDGWCGGLLYGL